MPYRRPNDVRLANLIWALVALVFTSAISGCFDDGADAWWLVDELPELVDPQLCEADPCAAGCCDGPAQSCLRGHCLDLGDACASDDDCATSQYCEPAAERCVDLGENPELCVYVPPAGAIEPVEAWAWSGSSASPSHDQVMMMPVVANLTDDDGDHRINEDDIPDVVFVSFEGSRYEDTGVLRVVSGDDGREHWSSTALPVPFWVRGDTTPAIGDLDGDGVPEIVVDAGYGKGVMAVRHDGTLLWHNTEAFGTRAGGPALADLDGDGVAEIVTRHEVLTAAGELGCRLSTGNDLPVVADLDVDGRPEILQGSRVHAYERVEGTESCRLLREGDNGMVAPLDADDDPAAELVQVIGGAVALIDDDGQELWRTPLPVDHQRLAADHGVPACDLPPAGQACVHYGDCGGAMCIEGTCFIDRGCHPGGGPPTVADFDGDGRPEFGVASRWYYLVFETDGSVLWAHRVNDYSSAMTGSSVFDFDGDGSAEVVYNDQRALRIFAGAGAGEDADGDGWDDGLVLAEVANASDTLLELPVVADVDNDGNAEIVVASNNYGDQRAYSDRHGVRVFADRHDRWVPTRRIWNQHAYSVTNIHEDGTFPSRPRINWQVSWLNNFRQNVQGARPFDAPNFRPEELRLDGTCGADLYVVFTLRNQGALPVGPGTVRTTVYAGPADGDLVPVATVVNTESLPSGGGERMEVKWTPGEELAGQALRIEVVADDDGTGSGAHQECDEEDNRLGLGACRYQ